MVDPGTALAHLRHADDRSLGRGRAVVYDTCVQVVHVIEDCCGVPVFTPAVAAVLVLAFSAAAGVFMRRRIAGRA